MKASELKALSKDELSQKVREARSELFDARVKHATGQLENPTRLGALRREIAKAETILRERREAN